MGAKSDQLSLQALVLATGSSDLRKESINQSLHEFKGYGIIRSILVMIMFFVIQKMITSALAAAKSPVALWVVAMTSLNLALYQASVS